MHEKYQPKHGVPYSQADADVICPELIRLAREHGADGLTPAQVVEVARDPDSPLHAYVFSKDQAEAAAAWYRLTAKRLVTSFEVVWRQNNQERRAGLFHYVIRTNETDEDTPREEEEPQIRPRGAGRPATPRSYRTVTDVMQSPAMRRQLIERATRELESWRQRHARLVELDELASRPGFRRVFEAICELFPDAEAG